MRIEFVESQPTRRASALKTWLTLVLFVCPLVAFAITQDTTALLVMVAAALGFLYGLGFRNRAN